MIRARDVIVLAALAWWLLRDREEVSVGLTQTCIGPDGDVIQAPLGQCPPGYTTEVYENGNGYKVEPTCNCIQAPCNC